MQAPTPTQIQTAIKVLNKLAERINTEADHSVLQLPESQLGHRYAGQIQTRVLEQTTQIQSLSAKLENWHGELKQQRRLHVSQRV